MIRTNSDLRETVLALRQEFDLTFAQAPRMETEQRENLLAIRIGDDPYAIRITEIGGLHADRRIMPLPTPMPELLGVMGFRGKIAPVYDLATLLGYARPSSTRWIVLLKSVEPVALAFDAFERHFAVSQLQIISEKTDMPAETGARPHLFDAVRSDDVVRPVIQLQSLLAAIQKRAQPFVQQRSIQS